MEKLGDNGRKMFLEHQKAKVEEEASVVPRLTLYLKGQSAPIHFPIDKITEVALKTLRSTNPGLNFFYKKEAWEFLKGFLLNSLTVERERLIPNQIFLNESMRECEIRSAPIQIFTEEKCRSTLIKGIAGLFVALSIKELAKDAYIFLIPFIRHFALVIIAEQYGTSGERSHNKMDPYVLFDAMIQVLTYEERDLKRFVFVALSILMNAVINIVGTKDIACSLPMIGHMTHKMFGLSYERASYTKMNGCEVLKFLLENMSTGWILCNHLGIVRAMHFVLADVTEVICVGALDLARENLRCLIRKCTTAAPSSRNIESLKMQSVDGLAMEFVSLLTSPTANVRKESMKGLELLAGHLGKSVSSLLEPYKIFLLESIPPKMILELPIPNQLGLLEANAFCLGSRPRLFFLDLNLADVKTFMHEIVSVCDPKIGNEISLELKMAMLRVICQISHFNDEDSNLSKERIFNLLVDLIGSADSDLSTCAFECVRIFTGDHLVALEMARAVMIRISVENNRRLVNSIPTVRQLIFMCQLFPGLYNQKMADKLLGILKRFLEGAVSAYKKIPARYGVYDLNSAVQTLSFFSRLPLCNRKCFERAITICLDAEKELQLGNNSPLRLPLMNFLIKQPQDYLELVFELPYIQNAEWNRFFFFFLEHEMAGDLRRSIVGKPERIIKHLSIQNCLAPMSVSNTEPNLIQYVSVRTLSTLDKFGEDWFVVGPDGAQIVKALRNLWEIIVYQAQSCPTFSMQNLDSLSRFQVGLWKKPRMIAQLLLSYYKKNTADIFLLFKLLLAFTGKVVPEFQFLKDFVEKSATKFCVQWKRRAFYAFMSVFEDKGYSDDLLAKIIQLILIPCIKYSFENGEGEELIGPDKNFPTNLVGFFLSRVINPCNQNGVSDVVRIPLAQLACLFVEHASGYLRDVPGKQTKLKGLITFAWPSSMSFAPTCVDSISKYYGHLLLCHIIAKFQIPKRIIVLVFHSLLTATSLEAKTVVKQALDILFPVLSEKVYEGQQILMHLTKKVILEEGHTLRVLQLIVRHWKVYFPVRHALMTDVTRGMKQLGMNPMSTFDHRKLAVEIAQIVIKWELERKRIERQEEIGAPPTPQKKMKIAEIFELTTPLEKTYTDMVVNFLMRFACQLNDANQVAGSSGDILANRCVSLVDLILKSHVWVDTDLDLSWLDDLFQTVDKPEFNVPNICTALELLTTIIVRFPKKYVQEHMKMLQGGISICMTSQISRVVTNVHAFLKELTSLFPIEAPSTSPNGGKTQKYKELEILYLNIRKVINFGLNVYDKRGDLRPLYRGLMILKSICSNNEDYVNAFIPQLMNVFQRLAKEYLDPVTNVDLVPELLLHVLHLVKNRIDIMEINLRRSFIGISLMELLAKSTDRKVMLEIITVLDEWIRNNNSDAPILQEKSILLGKLMQVVEKRFPGDNGLTAKFFDLVFFIYTDETLGNGRLAEKLRPAFLSALRSTNPEIRMKFSRILHDKIDEKLYSRIIYILQYPNWKTVGQQPHYWIKQWMELLLSTVIKDKNIQLTPKKIIIPGVTHYLDAAEPSHKDAFLKFHPEDINDQLNENDDLQFIQKIETDVENLQNIDKKNQELVIAKIEDSFLNSGWKDSSHPIINTKVILAKETQFGKMIWEMKLSTMTHAISQLVHLDNYLAEALWIIFFSRIWKILSFEQQIEIASEIVQLIQKWRLNQNTFCRSIGVFLRTLASKCDPPLVIPSLEQVTAELSSLFPVTANNATPIPNKIAPK